MLVNISTPDGRSKTVMRRESEETDHLVQKEVQRFCFIRVLPKDGVGDAKSLVQDAIKLFEEKDQRLLQISESIRQRLNDREDEVSRLQHLKRKYLDTLKGSIARKKDLLTQLYLALDNISFPKCSSEETLEKHEEKLNFRMQHKTNNLAQERKLFREINLSQQTNNASALPIPELQFILSAYCHNHDNRKKCDKRLEEIKQFEVTRKVSKGLREEVKNQIKVVCDELMEMRKKKKGVEAKIKVAEKEFEAINEEIWSFQEHLKDNHQRKEANYWGLKYGNLDDNSIHFNTIFAQNVNGVIKILLSAGFPY